MRKRCEPWTGRPSGNLLAVGLKSGAGAEFRVYRYDTSTDGLALLAETGSERQCERRALVAGRQVHSDWE